MKKILYKRNRDIHKGTKRFSIFQKSEDKECVTLIKKGFTYKVALTSEINPKVDPPRIDIIKAFDTKKKTELFEFDVKGCFYLTHERKLVKVDFHHSLRIKLAWKSKIFSPKKSAILT